MRTINTFRDLCAEVEDCGLHDPNLYHENWAELVARKYLHLLRDKYGFEYGNKIPKLDNDDEFWDLFQEFEIEE